MFKNDILEKNILSKQCNLSIVYECMHVCVNMRMCVRTCMHHKAEIKCWNTSFTKGLKSVSGKIYKPQGDKHFSEYLLHFMDQANELFWLQNDHFILHAKTSVAIQKYEVRGMEKIME